MEIVRFDNEDVIATSGVIATLAGFRNGIFSDATLTVGGKIYGMDNWDDGTIIAALLPGTSGVGSFNVEFIWGNDGTSNSSSGKLYYMQDDIYFGNDEIDYYSPLTNGSYAYSHEDKGIHYFGRQ